MKRSALMALLLATACFAPAFQSPPFDPVAEPSPDEVAAVLFLVGDAGAARVESSSLVHRLRNDVERWSEALARDSAVTVAFLGDNIYPVGLRDRNHADFATDSARLFAQVWTVSGPQAREHRSLGLFLAGNHDWGNRKGVEGVARLRNQGALLQAFAKQGPLVSLIPEAGEPGPVVLDFGEAFRLVALDTHWWLQAGENPRKDEVMRDLRAALRVEDDRPIVVAAHHPYASGGPHSGRSTGFDPLWLLRRTGAAIQDVNSTPFRELLTRLGNAFEAEGAPVVFAAGHDHSLQVIEGDGPRAPAWTLVSGAGSKLTPVAEAPGLRWAGSRPGYMKLVFRSGGGVDVFVEAEPEAFLHCPEMEPERGTCVERGVAGFEIAYSATLRR